MTLMLMYKKCPRCRKRYAWNPDVGKMCCPRCGWSEYPGIKDYPVRRKRHL